MGTIYGRYGSYSLGLAALAAVALAALALTVTAVARSAGRRPGTRLAGSASSHQPTRNRQQVARLSQTRTGGDHRGQPTGPSTAPLGSTTA